MENIVDTKSLSRDIEVLDKRAERVLSLRGNCMNIDSGPLKNICIAVVAIYNIFEF